MEIILTFQTARAAINGERHLLEAGIKVKAMALPSYLGAGCGLCLRLEEAKTDEALTMLKERGFEPEGVFRRMFENGRIVYRAAFSGDGP